MPSIRLLLQTFFAGVILTCFATAAYAEQAVQFSWAVLADTATGLKPLDFTASPPRLKTGTTLQLYIEQKQGTFLYIYLLDSTGGLTLIFPGDPDLYNAVATVDRTFRIPPESSRFELMPPGGQEKLYLLASPVRLEKLENRTTEFLHNPSDPATRAGVIHELKSLRRRHSSLAQKTETSVPVAGTIRSRGIDESFEATRVKADDFYSRILRINHE